MSKFKYVSNGNYAVVFSEAESHAEVAHRMFGDVRAATGAGFGSICAYLDGHSVDISLFGSSTTLGIGVHPHDEMLVKFALGLAG